MSRHVFYSLHYEADRTRVTNLLASQVVEASREATEAEWLQLRRSGEFAIQRWLETQLKGRSCLIVLIGKDTASRPRVLHEIKRARQLHIGLLGVHIHHLKDANGQQSEKGENPFEHPESGLGSSASKVPVYDPPETDNQLTYRYIVDNIAQWADEAAALTRSWS